MEIKRDSFVYKVAYGLKSDKPKETSLCRLFWRFSLFLIVVWPLYCLAWKPIKWFFISILVLVGFVIGFLFGYRPAIFKDETLELMVPYKKWPVIRERRVALPVWVLYVFVIAFLAFTCFDDYQKENYISSGVGLGFIILLSLIGLDIFTPKRKKKSKKFGIVSAYVRAKKEKVCPQVVFVD